MDFRHQPEHEDSLPAEVRGGSNAGMAQELMSGLYNQVSQSVGDVKAITRSLVLLAPKTPQSRGGVLV